LKGAGDAPADDIAARKERGKGKEERTEGKLINHRQTTSRQGKKGRRGRWGGEGGGEVAVICID
jgi:hypothetical protein